MVGSVYPRDVEGDGDGSLEFRHETLEVFILMNFAYASMRLTCSNMTKLALHFVVEGEAHAGLPLMEVNCPKLTALHVCGFNDLSRLPTILCVILSKSRLRGKTKRS